MITGNKKVLVALSGGVDSSVAAFLLQKNGFSCTGAMMKLFDAGETAAAQKGCCTLSDAEDARAVAARLGFPFFVFNFTRIKCKQYTEAIETFIQIGRGFQRIRPPQFQNFIILFQALSSFLLNSEGYFTIFSVDENVF